MFKKLLGVAVMLVSFAATAQANEHDAAIHHHYLLGEWSCIGHVDTPLGQRLDTVGTWKIKRAFRGHIYDRFENYAGNGFAYKAKGITTYDKLAGLLNRHVLSSMGSWTRYVSKGWEDASTLTWEGESHRFGHPTTPIEQIITKKDDDTFELRVRVQEHNKEDHKDGHDSDGWKNMYKGTCTREGAAEGHKDDDKSDAVDDSALGGEASDIEDEDGLGALGGAPERD